MMNFIKNYFLLIIMLVGSVFVIVMAFKVPITMDNSVTITQNEAVNIPPPIEGKVVQDFNQPQVLPKEDVTILKADGSSIVISAEMATTARETSIGMMFRDTVPEKTGMLFLFEEIQEHAFWMKNTFVSLDILYIDSDKKISKIHEMAVPSKLDQISSGGEVLAVLEIGGGQAKSLGLTVGDVVQNAQLDLFLEHALKMKAEEKEEVFTEE